MESYINKHYECIKKALEGVGLKMDKIHKKGKKTVIIISRTEISKKMINPLVQDKRC